MIHNSLYSNTTCAGNPLNCDCETKWLRNWVAELRYYPINEEQEEPRCYFPKSLSGNPLHQLRSSRFTCDTNRRSGSVVHDGCNAVPLKTPAQLLMTAVTDAGMS